jgi:hypothetical protein
MSLRFLRFFAGPLLGLALVWLFASSVQAQELYTVSGVHVDAVAASSAEALNLALAQGRPRAWQTLYRRLTREQDWPRQPALDGAALLRMSRGYTIANERRSTTRYVADVTYIFNPDAVNRTLQGAGIAFTQSAPHRILIVPMAPSFSTGPWAQALAGLRDSVVPFTVASAADGPGLNALNFDSANWGDVASVAARSRAGEAALVQVIYVNNKVTVNIRRLGPGQAPFKISLDVPLAQTVGTTYPSAAQAAIHAIEEMWKTRAALDVNQRGRITVIAKPATAAEWGALRSALAGVDNVTSVQVTAMDIGHAQLVIAYQGNTDQLRDAMGAAGLSLANRSGEWNLAANGGGQ